MIWKLKNKRKRTGSKKETRKRKEKKRARKVWNKIKIPKNTLIMAKEELIFLIWIEIVNSGLIFH